MIIFVFIFGVLIGSFLNVVILRLPKEQPLTGRSHCLHCGHILTAWELVPLFSFLVLGGKCHACKKSISPRYFIIEAITGLLFAAGWFVINPYVNGQWVIFIEWLVLVGAAVVIFVIDLEHFLIFDIVVFPALIIMILMNGGASLAAGQHLFSSSSYFLGSILGALCGALPFFLIWYFSDGKWMGFGDVKLMLFLGAATRLASLPVTFLMAILSGGLVSGYLLIFTKLTLKARIPFGTFLTAAALIAFLWGGNILHWYLGLLGW